MSLSRDIQPQKCVGTFIGKVKKYILLTDFCALPPPHHLLWRGNTRCLMYYTFRIEEVKVALLLPQLERIITPKNFDFSVKLSLSRS